MRILSIETSCDDTAISIMETKGGLNDASFKVLANNSNSQIKIHIPYGGVFPMLAKREHVKNLPILFEASLKEAKLDKKKKPIDAIMVTSGPGLEPCLWTGIVFAKELAEKYNIPLMPVNHMEGHILSISGKSEGKFKVDKQKTPIISLLVSGGHTQLVLSKKTMEYKIIGETLDDAVGEAFDKVARMMQLPYPGGPEISKLAEEKRKEEVLLLGSLGRNDGDGQRKFSAENFRADKKQNFFFSLPRPMLHTKDFNFSYSGLKTAVLYLIQKIGTLDENTKKEIALEFENAAIECLVKKTSKAIEKYEAKTLIVAGGVSANKYLREEVQKLANDKKINLLLPTKELSVDNSIMIGIAGYLQYTKKKGKVPKISSIKADGNLRLK